MLICEKPLDQASIQALIPLELGDSIVSQDRFYCFKFKYWKALFPQPELHYSSITFRTSTTSKCRVVGTITENRIRTEVFKVTNFLKRKWKQLITLLLQQFRPVYNPYQYTLYENYVHTGENNRNSFTMSKIKGDVMSNGRNFILQRLQLSMHDKFRKSA